MPKFEAKKEDFAKIWQKLGAIARPAPPAAPPMKSNLLNSKVFFHVHWRKLTLSISVDPHLPSRDCPSSSKPTMPISV